METDNLEPPVPVSGDDELMNFAIEYARASSYFPRDLLAEGSIDQYFIKVPVKDGDEIEHVWLDNVSYGNGHYEGTVNNTPEHVTNIKVGDVLTVQEDKISDWNFVGGGKIWGSFTTRVVFLRELENGANLECTQEQMKELQPMDGFLDDYFKGTCLEYKKKPWWKFWK